MHCQEVGAYVTSVAQHLGQLPHQHSFQHHPSARALEKSDDIVARHGSRFVAPETRPYSLLSGLVSVLKNWGARQAPDVRSRHNWGRVLDHIGHVVGLAGIEYGASGRASI